ncbi:TonB-dependent receptor plug domain-containing protein [Acinetobacter amyesii]|uniref:TonB-dependent receptor plug domain-containing protein n=1 Tax=Acinetobacter amyesii TaxID=2942470 RepID=UPI003F04B9A3
MHGAHTTLKLTSLSYALLTISTSIWAADTVQNPQESVAVQQMEALTFEVPTASTKPKDPDISAVAKTIISRDEMLKFGDQSINDALRRAAGFQLPGAGGGPRGGAGAGGMRFRGGGAPVFLINGEPVQGGPRGGMSVVDSITPEMIERLEITKQPSVAQGSVASSAVINIILKEPLNGTRLSGSVRAGYGLTKSNTREEERTNLNFQMDGRSDPWIYSLSGSQMWNDSDTLTRTQDATGTKTQKRITNRTSQMLTPRVEYQLDDQQKLVAEMFYRNNESEGTSGSQVQKDKNDSIRLNTRYERKDQGNSDKIRLSIEQQNETELTEYRNSQSYIDEQINEYGLGYDGVRKFDSKRQIKFGTDLRSNELESNIAETLDEQLYAAYVEGSWKYTPRQTLTLGVRQEWIDRSGLVDYQDQHLSPVLAHRFDFNDQWSLQTNLSQAFKNPRSNQLMPTVSVSTDSDAGTLNNPDRGGNPDLRPETINAYETTLGYNTSAGGVNITAYYREINDYIEKSILSENTTGGRCEAGNTDCRFVERPYNQDSATTYGVEIAGRYALKQTENGHSFMLNAQLSTIRAKIEETDGSDRLASDVAPYTASAGLSYNYQPWRIATSVNLNYTPEYTRALSNEPYNRTSNERVNMDVSFTKRFDQNWSASVNARNILSSDYKEVLKEQSSGALYQSRINESIPSFMFTLEKKF